MITIIAILYNPFFINNLSPLSLKSLWFGALENKLVKEEQKKIHFETGLSPENEINLIWPVLCYKIPKQIDYCTEQQ